MSLPLFILAIASIFIGYIFRDAFIGLGSSFFGNSIMILPKNADIAIESEFISAIYK
jgi:NADH-ubiquinone oxidoreductase chain 5